jgi:N-acetylneuraminic acid mutarotase
MTLCSAGEHPGVAVDERTAGRAGRPARRGYKRLIRSPWHLAWLAVILATACTGVARDHAAAPRRTPQPRTATEQTEIAATWAAYQLPAALTGATAVSNGGHVLLFGGDSAGRPTRSVTRLAPGTGKDQVVGSLPAPVSNAAAAVIRGRLTVFGGSPGHSSRTVQTIRPPHGGRAQNALPGPRAGAAAVTVGDTTYLVGGGRSGHPDPAILATKDGAHFRTAAQLAVPVMYASAVAWAGQLLVAGGMTAKGRTDAIQLVNPRTKQARVIGRLPRPVAAGSMFLLDDQVVFAGGSLAGNAGQDAASASVSNALLTIDPRTGGVRAAGTLPMPVAHAASAVVGHTAYLIGGTDGARSVPQVTQLRATSTWNMDPPEPWLAPASGRGHLAPGSKPAALPADVLVADHLNNRLVIIDPQGRIRWAFPRPGDLKAGQSFRVPDDAFFSPDGKYIIATQEDDQVITVISVATSKIVYRYGKPGTPGMGPNRVDNPDDALVLPGGDIIAADIKNCRIILINPPAHRPAHVIGQSSNLCVHDPPRHFGSPNGAFPMTNGGYVVTEINGDWANGINLNGHVQWSTHPPGVFYPSDTTQVYPGCYLTVDYSYPGQVVEFTPRGKLLWRRGGLNKPSLAVSLPNGFILLNDDYNHRIVVINPANNHIVWQYGHTGRAGRAPGYLNDPDGLDLVPPDSLLIRHAGTAGQP